MEKFISAMFFILASFSGLKVSHGKIGNISETNCKTECPWGLPVNSKQLLVIRNIAIRNSKSTSDKTGIIALPGREDLTISGATSICYTFSSGDCKAAADAQAPECAHKTFTGDSFYLTYKAEENGHILTASYTLLSCSVATTVTAGFPTTKTTVTLTTARTATTETTTTTTGTTTTTHTAATTHSTGSGAPTNQAAPAATSSGGFSTSVTQHNDTNSTLTISGHVPQTGARAEVIIGVVVGVVLLLLIVALAVTIYLRKKGGKKQRKADEHSSPQFDSVVIYESGDDVIHADDVYTTATDVNVYATPVKRGAASPAATGKSPASGDTKGGEVSAEMVYNEVYKSIDNVTPELKDNILYTM